MCLTALPASAGADRCPHRRRSVDRESRNSKWPKVGLPAARRESMLSGPNSSPLGSTVRRVQETAIGRTHGSFRPPWPGPFSCSLLPGRPAVASRRIDPAGCIPLRKHATASGGARADRSFGPGLRASRPATASRLPMAMAQGISASRLGVRGRARPAVGRCCPVCGPSRTGCDRNWDSGAQPAGLDRGGPAFPQEVRSAARSVARANQAACGLLGRIRKGRQRTPVGARRCQPGLRSGGNVHIDSRLLVERPSPGRRQDRVDRACQTRD